MSALGNNVLLYGDIMIPYTGRFWHKENSFAYGTNIYIYIYLYIYIYVYIEQRE